MFWVAFDLSSANAFNLGKPKILSSGKGLIVQSTVCEKRASHSILTVTGKFCCAPIEFLMAILCSLTMLSLALTLMALMAFWRHTGASHTMSANTIDDHDICTLTWVCVIWAPTVLYKTYCTAITWWYSNPIVLLFEHWATASILSMPKCTPLLAFYIFPLPLHGAVLLTSPELSSLSLVVMGWFYDV